MPTRTLISPDFHAGLVAGVALAGLVLLLLWLVSHLSRLD